VLYTSATKKQFAPATLNDDGTWTADPTDLSALPDGPMTVKATAVDAAGNKGVATQVVKLAAHPSLLTERVSSAKIVYGKAVTVAGRLLDQDGDPIDGATISVRPRNDAGHFGKAHTTKTNSDGKWAVLFAPKHNATFYAAYAGSSSPVTSAAAVHTARTLVKVALRFTEVRDGQKVAAPVDLSGRVAPHKKGAKVTVFRKTKTGTKSLGKAVLDNTSRWHFTLKLPKGTSVAVFAVIGKTSGNLGNRTALTHLTAK
jgi:hypothetical protein